jgi:uncharacterized protein
VTRDYRPAARLETSTTAEVRHRTPCALQARPRLLIWTGAGTGKVKRIRRNPRVLIAPADYRGHELGPQVEAQARVLGPEAEAIVVPLLRRKYGWQRRALEIAGRLSSLLRRRPAPASVYLELR